MVPRTAFTVTVFACVTGIERITKVPTLVVPGINKVEGTVAKAGSMLSKVTVTPAAGGRPVNRTVAPTLPPPLTVLSPNVKESTEAASTFKVVDYVTVSRRAYTVTVVVTATGFVVTTKVFVFAPAPITVVPGTVAAALLVHRVINRPPGGASDASDTVPVADSPPGVWLGLIAMLDKAGGSTNTLITR